MKIAYDIQWDIDMDEVYELLDDMTAKKAAKALEISVERYSNLTNTHGQARGVAVARNL